MEEIMEILEEKRDGKQLAYQMMGLFCPICGYELLGISSTFEVVCPECKEQGIQVELESIG